MRKTFRPIPFVVVVVLAALPLRSAFAQETRRPEERPDYAEMPVETEHKVACRRVYKILAHPKAGDIMLFGSKGFAGSIAWPSGELRRLEFPVTDDIFAAAFGSNDDSLFLAGTDGIVRQFKRGDMALQHSYPKDDLWADRTIRTADISPDDKLLATGGDSGQVRLYDLETHEEVVPYEGAKGKVTSLVFSPDGKTLAIGVKTGVLHLVDPRNVESAHTLQLHKGSLYGIAFTKDGKRLLTAGSDGKVHAVDTASRKVTNSVTVGPGPLPHLSLATNALDRPLLVVGGNDGRVWFVHGETLEILLELPTPRPDMTTLAINERGFFLSIACKGGVVRRIFAYKLLRGDTIGPGWLENAEAITDAATYEKPAARIGLQLTPATIGAAKGLQVTGWLFGFPKPTEKASIPLGSVVTHVRHADGFRPVGEALELPGGFEHAMLRYVTSDGETRETILPLVSAAQARTRGEVARALQAKEPIYDVGFDVLDSGVIRRVEGSLPEGLDVTCRIVSVGGRPWKEVGPDWWRFSATPAPIRLETEGKPGTSTVELTPQRVAPIVQTILLAAHLYQAGRIEEGQKTTDTALRISEDDWRLYYHLVRALGDEVPADEVLKGLENGIKRCGRDEPLYEAMAPFMERRDGPAGVVKLLRNPVGNFPHDHELRLE